ncbi:transcription initiation factor TFIID subunit 4-like [Trachypithecus francoisi]|uniref:transcription initiation factor TFIID subunit 4-like n=1 Tax=Trachypithecus francoisi TaxID=54180 RepID=UPI00141AF9D5|nr:transcription initiation factor TFIID subunit 4-like [Trachypithecus francoisi]
MGDDTVLGTGPAVHSVPENTRGLGLISRNRRRRLRPVPSGPEASPLTPLVPEHVFEGPCCRGCYSRLDLGPCCYPRPPSPPRGLHGPGLSCGLLLGGALGVSSSPKAHFIVPGVPTTAGAGQPPTPSSARAPLPGADDRGLTPGPTAHSRLPPFLHGQGSHTADAPFSAAPLISEFGSQCVRLSVPCHGHWDPFAAAGRSPDGRWEDLASLRPPPPSSGDPGRGSQPLGFPARVLREGPGLGARRPATARAHAPAASPRVQDSAAPARALVRAPRLSAPPPPARWRAGAGLKHRVHQSAPSPAAALASQMLQCAPAHAETGAAASGPTAREQSWLAKWDTQ